MILPHDGSDDSRTPTHYPDDAATAYALAVGQGRVLACKWVRLACQRHLADWQRAAARDPDFPYRWDGEEVEDMRLYFLGLKHSKGRWAKPVPQPIALEPWQLFVLGSLWGWKRLDGTRRFRVAYVEVARKNTKSTIAAGVGLRLAFDDDEPGAEVYAVATKLKQARVVWDEARRMVLKSPGLRRRVRPLVGLLHAPATESRFEPLGADSDKLDGLNIHGASIDEFHAHKTPQMWDVLDTATGARDQPLLFAITTAGFNLAGPCYERRALVTKVLEGLTPDESLFGIIYTLDEGDDWRDPACWGKANPMLGLSVDRDELAAQCHRAIEMPSARTSFLTKRLNVWVNAGAAEVDLLAWGRAQCAITLAEFREAPCWVGVDLASKSDLAAVVAVFERDGHLYLKPKFYLPRAVVQAEAHAAAAHYAGWAAGGALTLTEGNLIDFGVIRADLLALAAEVTLQEIAFDPYQAAQLQTELSELGLGAEQVVDVPQTVKSFSAPMYAIRDRLKAGTLHHDGNPVMTWCASNVVTREDDNENLFPRKAARHLKIDGYTALLTALSRALVAPPPMTWEATVI